MMPYATYTGTRRNLDAMRAHGWRLLVTPDTHARNGRTRPRWVDGTPAGFGLDNGAWGSHRRGEPFNVPAFERTVSEVGTSADWLILPDIVGGGLESLRVSMEWAPRLHGVCPLLVAVQDGMTPADVAPLVGPGLGVALGGSTEWKEGTLAAWGALARRCGAYFHVLRVNTCRRIDLCRDAGAHSFDGTSVTRFVKTLPLLDGARRQLSLLNGAPYVSPS